MVSRVLVALLIAVLAIVSPLAPVAAIAGSRPPVIAPTDPGDPPLVMGSWSRPEGKCVLRPELGPRARVRDYQHTRYCIGSAFYGQPVTLERWVSSSAGLQLDFWVHNSAQFFAVTKPSCQPGWQPVAHPPTMLPGPVGGKGQIQFLIATYDWPWDAQQQAAAARPGFCG